MKYRLLAALLVLAAAAPGYAAEFSVTPVRIFMSPRDRAVAVTLTNEGSEEVVIQTELFAWKQKPDGQDELTPTDDLTLSPPIIKLAPNARQVVRLARVGPAPTTQEQTFRMIVREVPEARPSTETKVQLALAFSLPIFITPPNAKRQLDCSPERTAADTVNVTCQNLGRAYAQARGFTLLAANGDKLAARETGGYILPQIKRTFEVKAPARIPAGAVTVQVALDDGTTQSFGGRLPE